MTKRALITGVTGQDGSYLAEFLLNKGYSVWGMYRRSSVDGHRERLTNLEGKIKLICGDLLDYHSLSQAVDESKPHEIYNLAAQSDVRISFDQPYLTKEINWFGVERLLDIAKEKVPSVKFYQASTSEMFGAVLETPQNENTPFNPVSPYAKSKVLAHQALERERQNGLFACSGILFNHESPRRGINFVTRKFTDGIARIKLGLPQRETGKDYLEMGNLNAQRDWGFSEDYVEAMWLMLQQEKPEDFIIATGETRTIKEFIETAANYAGIKISWNGEGVNEEGYDQGGKKILSVNPKFFRPSEVNILKGDSSKARNVLGWKPKTTFEEMVKLMVQEDLKRLEN